MVLGAGADRGRGGDPLNDLLNEFDPFCPLSSKPSTSSPPLFISTSHRHHYSTARAAVATPPRGHNVLGTQITDSDPLDAAASQAFSRIPDSPLHQPALAVPDQREAKARHEARHSAFAKHLDQTPFGVASGSNGLAYTDLLDLGIPLSASSSGPVALEKERGSSPALASDVSRSPLSASTALPNQPPDPDFAVVFKGLRAGLKLAIDHDLAVRLVPHLPRRLRLTTSWDLLYSLDRDGTSLATLYDRVGAGMRHDPSAGCVIVVLSSAGRRFGAFITDALRCSREYYGSGECFLWSAPTPKPEPKADVKVKPYMWTGRNTYTILSDAEALCFGGGDGKFGLWIDSALERGVSSRCLTFDNDILCEDVHHTALGEEEGSFDIIGLEAWRISI